MKARRIVITGVSRGLGRALTEEWARLGSHEVHGCCRSAAAVAELSALYPRPHSFAVVDVAADREVQAWAEALRQRGMVPDLLINNAALINRSAPLWELAADDVDAVIDVNVKGVANVLRHLLPGMIQQGTGVVVNISSGWGRSADADVAPYCASKWAIEGLTQALALELPEGLAAVAVNPGIIDTDMLRRCFGSAASTYPSPADWARRAAPFLLRLGPKENGHQLTVPG
jgi:NAD(P)-dependent dehydrogenase (short-subunit alcohol dehydrogenase family)